MAEVEQKASLQLPPVMRVRIYWWIGLTVFFALAAVAWGVLRKPFGLPRSGAYRFIPLGLGLVPILILTPVYLWCTRAVRKALLTSEGHLCTHCAYNLLSLPDSGTCPECGERYDFAIDKKLWENVGARYGEETDSGVADARNLSGASMADNSDQECIACTRISRFQKCGPDPFLIGEMGESYLVLADNQTCKGWCILLLKDHVEHMAELSEARQELLWRDVARTAEAIRAEFGPVRINYECLGNLMHHIHWHVIPRHADDPDPKNPVWLRSKADLSCGVESEVRDDLVRRIRARLRLPGCR